ncbi:hypothetical protein Cgig2_008543 [Carnegiea gigantea]|uniref:Pentatricopeptide repeat-containing protein n=1 Tax=Carnegiea gigantea TaxID=171969 RepID=A0A9Q1JXD9_9CARY|nr:hypothetical protein Cgig2_008543 [Carnegiea gigantea]
MTILTHCLLTPSQNSISKFISDHPHFRLLENHCTTMQDIKQIHAHLIKTGLSKDPIAIGRALAFSATSSAADINYAYSIFTHIEKSLSLYLEHQHSRLFSKLITPECNLSFHRDVTHFTYQAPTAHYPSLFKAYAHLGLACDGAQLNGWIIKLGLEFDPFIRNTIIYMYVNSGFLSEAYKLFDKDEGNFDVVAWNSMIMGLAKSGKIDESRRLFDKMGPKRNAISWNGMISGCVRNGKLLEAMELFQRMQKEGTRVSEFTLKHGNIEMAAWAAKHIHKSDSNDSAAYMVMANIYAASGQFEDAIKQRILMKENQVSKERGGSCIEINGQVQEFVSAGKLHPQMRELMH